VRPRHVSVLAGRIVELLAPALGEPGAVAVDATLGLGGHTVALLSAFPGLRVIGIDRDPSALAAAGSRIAEDGLSDRFTGVHAVYDAIGEIVARHTGGSVDAVLFDLGVSSMQIDQAERGFAYAIDAPLDMRMDPGTPVTAAEVLNTYPERELARVLSEYGEERFARRIAAAVVRERDREPFRTSGRLVDLIRQAIPAPARRTGGNPAKRTFQALRIEVNDELGAVRRAMPAALDTLRVGGRIAVITFHSLEDRIAKRAIAERTVSDTPEDLPVDLPGHGPEFRWLVRGETPAPAEMAANPRAESARLRVAERIAPRREHGGSGRQPVGRR
jgi:16S rRNA (cytosine1402-N4)-methyltransferase